MAADPRFARERPVAFGGGAKREARYPRGMADFGGASGWDAIEAEAREAFAGPGRFPLPAYSELMPAPHVVLKPYEPRRAARPCTATAGGDGDLDVTEYEQAHE